jgi:hypothetical protein
MAYLFANLFGLIGLVGVCYLAGWLVDHLLMQGRGLEPLSGPARFALGAAVWMGLLFIAAALGLLNPAALGLLCLLILVGVWRVRQAMGAPLLPNDGPGAATAVDRPSRVVALGVMILLMVLWLQSQWPQISWDAAVYHLTVPRLYIEQGGFRRIPFNVYSNWPLNTQLLYAMAQMIGDYVLAKAVHFAFGVATVVAIYRAVERGSAKWVGWVGAALFLANPVVLDEMRAAYVDLAYACFFFLAFLFVHFALENAETANRQLLLAGVFAGVVAGIKPTGVLGVVCLVMLYLVVSLRRRSPLVAALGGAMRILVPAGLLLTPWLLKSWILTGNPTYPFFYSVFGGPEWSAELGKQLREWQLGMGMGRSWLDYLLLPWRVVVEGGPGYDHFDGRLLPAWLVLVPLALVVGRRRPLIFRSLGVAGSYWVFWALSSQQMRFLIPILPLLAVAGALAIDEAIQRVASTVQPVLRWGSSLIAVGWLVLIVWGQASSTRMMVGQYLEQGRDILASGVHPVFEFIDEELPPDARLLFLNTNHGFFCDREFVADSFFEASQINALLRQEEGPEGVGRALRALGITHLLIENRDRFVPWPESLFEYLNDRSRTQPLWRSEDKVYDVVEVLSAPRRAP